LLAFVPTGPEPTDRGFPIAPTDAFGQDASAVIPSAAPFARPTLLR
jgi:hypothetical protein